MEETKEQQGLYRSLQFGIYLSVVLEVFFFYEDRFLLVEVANHSLLVFAERLSRVSFYAELINSKLFTLVLICLVYVGTLSRKKKDLNPKNQIVYPLALGMLILFSGLWLYGREAAPIWQTANWYDLAYVVSVFAGTILVHVAMYLSCNCCRNFRASKNRSSDVALSKFVYQTLRCFLLSNLEVVI